MRSSEVKMFDRRIWLFFGAIVAACAGGSGMGCGGSSSDDSSANAGSADSDSGADDTSDAGGAVDSGSTKDSGSNKKDAGSSTGGDGSTSTAEVGYGSLTLSNYFTTVNEYDIYAGFLAGPQHANGCISAPINGCCVLTNYDFPDVEADPGTITIDDGSQLLATMNAFGSPAVYPDALSILNSSIRWAPGDTFNVSAAGASLAGFSGSIVAPGPVTGLIPALPTGSPVFTQSIASDLTVHWTPDANSTDFTWLLQSPGGDALLECNEPQSQGSFAVDHSFFAGFAPTDVVAITAVNSNTVHIDAAGSPVTLVARSQVGRTNTITFTN
jgi:hypothetical protein